MGGASAATLTILESDPKELLNYLYSIFLDTFTKILIKNGFLEFKRSLHPNAILPVRYNTKSISKDIVFNILGFFILYMLSFIIGALVFSMFDINFESSVGLAASSLGNVGPALGDFGPVNNYSALPSLGKWWASFLMLLGLLISFLLFITMFNLSYIAGWASKFFLEILVKSTIRPSFSLNSTSDSLLLNSHVGHCFQ
mgnify:CR=1 FL=1